MSIKINVHWTIIVITFIVDKIYGLIINYLYFMLPDSLILIYYFLFVNVIFIKELNIYGLFFILCLLATYFSNKPIFIYSPSRDIVFPSSFIFLSIWKFAIPFTISLIVSPLTIICFSFLIFKESYAMLQTIFPLSFVDLSIKIFWNPFSIH